MKKYIIKNKRSGKYLEVDRSFYMRIQRIAKKSEVLTPESFNSHSWEGIIKKEKK